MRVLEIDIYSSFDLVYLCTLTEAWNKLVLIQGFRNVKADAYDPNSILLFSLNIDDQTYS